MFHLIDSRVYIYLYGIVIVVGLVDSVDNTENTPQVETKTRFALYLLLDSIFDYSFLVDKFGITYQQLWSLMTLSSGHNSYFPKFSIFWFINILPPIYGGFIFKNITPYMEQLCILSTGKGSSPQFLGTYPQI